MRTTVDPKVVGSRIRRLRTKRGMSQEQLAGSKYSAAYISHLENGKRTPSGKALEHLSTRLGISVQQLVTGRDPDLDLQLQLQVDRAIARVHSGDRDVARAELEAIRKNAHHESLHRAEATAEEGLGLIAQRDGKWTDASVHFSKAETLLADEPPEARTSAVTGRARCLFASNEPNHAIHLLETHLVELNTGGSADPTAVMQTYSALIGPYFEAGLREHAASIAEEAHQLEAQVQDPEHLACLNINRAQILIEQGHREEALRALARAEDLFKQLGWRDSAAKAAVARATAAVEMGDLDAGERQATAALTELEQAPSVLDKVRILNLLARIERLRRRPRKALAHLEAVAELLGENKSMEQAWRLREAALCYLALNDPGHAELLLRDALETYREAGTPNQVATTAAYLGDVLIRMDRIDEAAEVYRGGLAELEDLAL